MPSLNFKAEFADKVERGLKTCTIRSNHKRPIKAGDVLYLFTGMRTSSCRRLAIVTCKSTKSIRIVFNRALRVRVAGRWLKHEEIRSLAHRDGFECLQDFVDFFPKTYGLPFEGKFIDWEP